MAVATQLHLARLHQDRVQLRSALEQRESSDPGESMILRFKAEEAQYREESRRLATKAEADTLEGELEGLQGKLQKQEETLTGLRAEYERRVDRRLKDGQARRVEKVQAEIAAWKKKISNKRQRLVQMGTMMANRTTEKQYLEGVLANCQAREAERGADLGALIAKRDQLEHERRRVEMEVEKAKACIVNCFSVPDTKNRRCKSPSGGWRGWS
jgi:chromosome segregation ATPase